MNKHIYQEVAVFKDTFMEKKCRYFMYSDFTGGDFNFSFEHRRVKIRSAKLVFDMTRIYERDHNKAHPYRQYVSETETYKL